MYVFHAYIYFLALGGCGSQRGDNLSVMLSMTVTSDSEGNSPSHNVCIQTEVTKWIHCNFDVNGKFT